MQCVGSRTGDLEEESYGMDVAIEDGMDYTTRMTKMGHEMVVVYNVQHIGRLAKVMGRRGHDLALVSEGKRFARSAMSCGTAYPTNNNP